MCLVVSEYRTDGEAQLLLVNLFCYGQLQAMPLAVALLEVRWNGVVNERFDALFTEVLLKTVALWAEYGENMVHVMCVVNTSWQANQRVLYMAVVVGCHPLPMKVVVIEMA